MLFRSNLLILLLLGFSLAQKVGVKSLVGYTCVNSALKWDFQCPRVVLPLDCQCRSEEFVTTAMSCVEDNTDNVKDLYEGWNYIRDQCHYWGNRTIPLSEMEELYRKRLPSIIDAQYYNNSDPLPVKVPSQLYLQQMVSTKDTKYHYNVGNYFAWAIIGYWGLVMVGGIITNAIRVLNPNIYNVFGNKRVTSLRKLLTLPALIGTNHHHPIRITDYVSLHMPTRGQTLIILGFLAINIAGIVSFIDVKGDLPLNLTSQSDRKLHYLANRTGIMAYGHIPLIVLFACRNNPFISLTGWSYDIFMTYHRWCARLMGINAIIHATAIYWSSLEEGVVMFKWHRIYNWRGGNIAAYMVIFMLIMSLRRFRANFYEIFKATHILMFLIFIICLIVHTSDYGWLAWLYTAIAFYVIEYSARLTRVIMSGGIQKAHFRNPGSDMYRITIPGGKRKWTVKPGSYVYIRILSKDMFLQSHPFSIFQSNTSEADDSLDLCCKAQLGATRKVPQKIIADPDKSYEANVMIEGPYGNENYICSYDSVLLFTGGVGFTAMHTYATNILKAMKPGQCLHMIWVVKDCSHLSAFEEEVAYLVRHTSNSNNSRKFRIFVTKPDQFELGTVAYANYNATSDTKKSAHETHSIVQRGPGMLSKNENIGLTSQATLIESATSPIDAKYGSEYNIERASSDYVMDGCHIVYDGKTAVNIDYGRPNIACEISDFIKTATGSKAICSCGPPMFVDVIRDGIVENILDSDSRVDYFEDAFSW